MMDSFEQIKNENIRKFLAILGKDEELQKKFAKIRNPEEAYALAASIQGGFTKEEFVTEMKKLYEELTQSLSEEDMAKVAGGFDEVSVTVVSTAAGVSVAVTTFVGASAL